LVIYKEGMVKPGQAGTYNGLLDERSMVIQNAILLLKKGLSLLKKGGDDKLFIALPNPKSIEKPIKDLVEQANGIFCGAMTFTLLHKYAHHFYGHTKYSPTNSDQAKKEEFDADDYAFDKIMDVFDSEKGDTLKVGTFLLMVSLMMTGKSLSGGKNHPDIHLRIERQIKRLDLNENDSVYALITLGVKSWALTYDHTLSIHDKDFASLREAFEWGMEELKRLRLLEQ
tara:strand:- start:577 stop:1257 length:681 start_codon:yes stop_codon:yes gene_type:complete